MDLNATIVKTRALNGTIIRAAGGSGTSDYDALTNRPQINSVTLTGDLSSSDLGLADANDVFSSSRYVGVDVLKGSGDTDTDNNGYYSFASGVIFNGKEVHAVRAGVNHYTQSGTHGKIVFYVYDADGTLTVTEPDINWSSLGYGDPRDPHLGVSTDGKVLFLMCPCTPDGTAASYTGVLFALDKDFHVKSYCTCSTANNQFVWGKILQTPNGYLLTTEYRTDADTLAVIRSSAAFTGSLTGVTFSVAATLHTGGPQSTECDIGYWHDYLVAVYRRNGNVSGVKYTENLEGTSGWSAEGTLEYRIESPVLLAKSDDKYLVFGGSYYQANVGRSPCVAVLDVINHSVKALSTIDRESITAGGYPSLVRIDDTHFSSVYYEEVSSTDSILYHKWFDIRPFYGFIDALDPDSQEITVAEISNHFDSIDMRTVGMELPLGTISSGKALKSDGTMANISAACVSDYIPVAPGYKYAVSESLSSSAYYNVFYNANKEVVSYSLSTGTAPLILTAPSGAAYLRANGLSASISSFKVTVYAAPSNYTDLTNKPSINSVTLSGNKTAADLGLSATVTEVTNSSAGAVSLALDAEKIYHFTGALTSLTLTLTSPASGQLAHYHFDFDSGSTAPTLTLPNTVTMPGGFTVEASKHYEIDILNSYGAVMAW